MVLITVELLRKRAEHNDGVLHTLTDISLHQQNIEKIELLGHLCRNLRVLQLQGNLICKIENLHRLKELRHLSLALNNITRIQNLKRCESLERLDLTANFVSKASLCSTASLANNIHFRELHLLGNPCTEWHGYRTYVVASLPQLRKLDGVEVGIPERERAGELLPVLQARLTAELAAEGNGPRDACAAEDDSLTDSDSIPETGHMGEDGEMRRPWCPATRVLEHREAQLLKKAAEDRKRCTGGGPGTPTRKPHTDFPALKDGERVMQKNEGGWEFSVEESVDGHAWELDVAVGRFLDTSLIKADVQPTFVRLLIKGHLLQLVLPQEIRPDRSTAQRSATTGRLLLSMPKDAPDKHLADMSCCRPQMRAEGRRGEQPATGLISQSPCRPGLCRAEGVSFSSCSVEGVADSRAQPTTYGIPPLQ